MKTICRTVTAVVIALCVAIVGCPFSAFALSGTCGSGAEWEFDEETGALTIFGSGAMTAYSFYTATPWYSFMQSIKTVTVSDGVTTVGKYAFNECSALERVTLGSTVEEIGLKAFQDCPRLCDVTLPNSLKKIGNYAFRNCTSVVSIDVPSGVTSIGTLAFDGVGNIAYSGTATGMPWGAKNTNGYAEGIFVYDSAEKQSLLWCSRGVQGSVEVADTVTRIDDRAFDTCAGLAAVTISAGVREIGTSAFSGCTSLSRVEFLGTIGQWCSILFENSVSNPILCAHSLYIGGALLTQAVIPDDVTQIGAFAFCGCSDLSSVAIGSAVTQIGSYAFKACVGLTSFTVSAENNAYSADENGILYNKEQTELILYPIGSAQTSLAVAQGVTQVDAHAFADCMNLTHVTLPESMTQIQASAFEDCASLTDVTIPDTVTHIGSRAFADCTGLANVTIPDSVTQIDENAFDGVGHLAYSGTAVGSPWGASYINRFVEGIFVFDTADKQTLLLCDRGVQGAVTVPDSVTTIGTGAFRDCRGLLTVQLPDTLERIEAYAFADSALSRLDIPAQLCFVGDQAIPESVRLITTPDSMQDVTADDPFEDAQTTRFVLILSNAMTAIPEWLSGAFGVSLGSGFDQSEDCLGSARPRFVHLSNAITDLGDDALAGVNYICAEAGNTFAESYAQAHQMGFRVCTGHTDGTELTDLYFCGERVFRSFDPETDTYTIYGDGPMFDREPDWDAASLECTRLVIEEGVSYIGAYAFENAMIGEIILPDASITIGANAFYCSAIDRITFPQDAEDVSQYGIDDDAFYDSDVLELDLGGLDGFPGGFRFGMGDNDSLQKLIVGQNTEAIDYYTCNCFAELQQVTLPDGLLSIGDGAFEGCGQLRTISVPNSVTSIGDYAFDYCTSLACVTLPKRLSHIGEGAFCSCESLESITIPDGVTSIGISVFESCRNLSEVTIPYSVTSIGINAFYDTALEHVHLHAGLQSIYVSAFGDSLSYVCCETEDCPVVKEFAEKNGYEFRLCDGHGYRPRVAGDADGDGKVGLKDAVLMRRYLADGWDVSIDTSAADVNSDGSVTLQDVVLLCRCLAGGWDVVLI